MISDGYIRDLISALNVAVKPERIDRDEVRRLLFETMTASFASLEIVGIIAGLLIDDINSGRLKAEDVRRAMAPLWLALQMGESTTEHADDAGATASSTRPALPALN